MAKCRLGEHPSRLAYKSVPCAVYGPKTNSWCVPGARCQLMRQVEKCIFIRTHQPYKVAEENHERQQDVQIGP